MRLNVLYRKLNANLKRVLNKAVDAKDAYAILSLQSEVEKIIKVHNYQVQVWVEKVVNEKYAARIYKFDNYYEKRHLIIHAKSNSPIHTEAKEKLRKSMMSRLLHANVTIGRGVLERLNAMALIKMGVTNGITG